MDRIVHLKGLVGEYIPRWIRDQYNLGGDLDGTILKKFLEDNGYTVVKSGDAGTHGFALTDKGYYISTNGYITRKLQKSGAWDKYLLVITKLQRRYTRPDGSLVMTIGKNLSRYLKLEKMAFKRYLNSC